MLGRSASGPTAVQMSVSGHCRKLITALLCVPFQSAAGSALAIAVSAIFRALLDLAHSDALRAQNVLQPFGALALSIAAVKTDRPCAKGIACAGAAAALAMMEARSAIQIEREDEAVSFFIF